ncbi:hypothetical protein P3T37_001160 [Kitasatospora sp. MAA4]|uniref:hypothetical protein n=1 Tax=Kitasatospora sp. MAA4 TaxID=3035093 RepID=UPI00247387A3|nr:hypothetical protein [Kitasatospora sp. MAA4]MDH6131786.1 hypothetical protein [Kitasatospora sp. MAA4]
MKDEIIARARFLLTDLHLPPVEANTRLKDYFPDLELEERARYLREARALPSDDADRTTA